jgi:hypothetical protein
MIQSRMIFEMKAKSGEKHEEDEEDPPNPSHACTRR